MAPFIQVALTEAITIFVFMSCLFLVSVVIRRNDIVDIGWGIGFIAATIGGLIAGGSISIIDFLIVGLVAIWGIRLATHIFIRNRHKPEDKRYATWRVEWGNWFYLRSFLQVYMLQGFLMFLILLPTTAVIASTGEYNSVIFIILGVLIWIKGFLFEAIGDAQLAYFLAQPQNKGKLMTLGLWQFTRHPNYFGEVTGWWGIWVISLAVAPWYFTIIGPLTITSLILLVSGIPMTERVYAGRADFEEYKKRTSAFIPWFPKK
jgi:steroid 5-alpha reductase family enzyme